jgi:hypothetical protein
LLILGLLSRRRLMSGGVDMMIGRQFVSRR